MANSYLLLKTGNKMYKFGKKGIKIGIPVFLGTAVLFLIAQFAFQGGFDTFADALIFDFEMLGGLQALVVIALYLMLLWVLISPTLYLWGLHFIGLGQIAMNTEKKD